MAETLEQIMQEIGSGKVDLGSPEPQNVEVDKPIDIEQKQEIIAEKPLNDKPVDQGKVEAPVEDIPDEKFYGRLSKMTGGNLKSEQEFVGMIQRYNDLQDQAEKGFQPKFKDERTKLVYQILAENAGNEPEAAMRTLRAISFNPEGKSPKEILFEAYLVDPKNSDLTPNKAQEYFEAEYEHKYGDLEGNLVKERMLSNEVKEASKTISDVANSFKTVEQEPAKISEAVQGSIFKAVDEFGGVKLAFTDNPQESDYLTMAIDQNEVETLKQEASNPQQWWTNFVEQFTNSQGQFDDNSYKEFVREFYEMKNHQKKADLAYQHGLKQGELAYVNRTRNASDPKQISQSSPAAAQGKDTMLDAWLSAKKG